MYNVGPQVAAVFPVATAADAHDDDHDESAAAAGPSAAAEPLLTADVPVTTGDPWRDLLLCMRLASLRSNAAGERREWLPKNTISGM